MTKLGLSQAAQWFDAQGGILAYKERDRRGEDGIPAIRLGEEAGRFGPFRSRLDRNRLVCPSLAVYIRSGEGSLKRDTNYNRDHDQPNPL